MNRSEESAVTLPLGDSDPYTVIAISTLPDGTMLAKLDRVPAGAPNAWIRVDPEKPVGVGDSVSVLKLAVN